MKSADDADGETSRPDAFSLAGRGDIVYRSCYLAEGGLMDDGEYRGVRYTLYVPTGEVFFLLRR